MSKTRVFSIRLDPRQAWAWQRLGQDAIRSLIAPPGICVVCHHRKVQINTRNGWFCYSCQDDLDQASLLPPDHTTHLMQQNRALISQIKQLQSQIEPGQTDSDGPSPHQLSLFEGPSP